MTAVWTRRMSLSLGPAPSQEARDATAAMTAPSDDDATINDATTDDATIDPAPARPHQSVRHLLVT
jgi:hypothetical protein